MLKEGLCLFIIKTYLHSLNQQHELYLIDDTIAILIYTFEKRNESDQEVFVLLELEVEDNKTEFRVGESDCLRSFDEVGTSRPVVSSLRHALFVNKVVDNGTLFPQFVC